MIVLLFLTVKIIVISTLTFFLTKSAFNTHQERTLNDTDGCESSPCMNGHCSTIVNGYTCICDAGWTGYNCTEDNCEWEPCVNGNCSNLLTGYTCHCEPGWTGNNCSNDIDECEADPCDSGICSNLINAYLCQCDPGWTGLNCSKKINMCEMKPCEHGHCSNLTNSYICSCHSGWTGYNCTEEIDECLTIPCIHGSCSDLINAYTCQCEEGWTGFNCSEDIDECENSPCNHGNCNNLHNAYSCNCSIGWMGLNCSQAVTNVALNKPTAMSSVYEGNPTLYGSDKGVDGNNNQQMYPDFSCFRNSENAESDPWWRVDLGGVYMIQTVTLYNRLDCCSNRAKDITLTLGISLAKMSIAGFVKGQIADIEEFNLEDDTDARFVQVTMNGTQSFHLCEVEVLGIPG